MSIIHPIADEWLMSYAAGALSEGAGLLVGSHVALCEQSAERLHEAELIHSALIGEIESVPVMPSTRAAVLEELNTLGVDNLAHASPETVSSSDLPPALARYLGGGLESVRWSFLAPGVRKARIWRKGDETLWLLRSRPGAKLPLHGHTGTELSLILSGAYSDATGQYCIGDVEEADESLEHQISVADDEECVCLSLTQGKLRLNGLVGRTLQFLMGM